MKPISKALQMAPTLNPATGRAFAPPKRSGGMSYGGGTAAANHRPGRSSVVSRVMNNEYSRAIPDTVGRRQGPAYGPPMMGGLHEEMARIDGMAHGTPLGATRKTGTDFGSKFRGAQASGDVVQDMMQYALPGPKPVNGGRIMTHGSDVNHGGGKSPALTPFTTNGPTLVPAAGDIDAGSMQNVSLGRGTPTGFSVSGPNSQTYDIGAGVPEPMKMSGINVVRGRTHGGQKYGGMYDVGAGVPKPGALAGGGTMMPADEAPMIMQRNVPKPTGPKGVAANMNANRGSAANAGFSLGMGGVALGVAGGATLSYMTGGDAIQGGIAGGVVGGIGYGMAAGGRGAALGAARMFGRGSTGRSFSRGVASAMKPMSSAEGRAGMYAGGAMLGGFVFGGNRSHKRGFNSKRGNSIGR
jgi:hypothetical protein